MISIVLLLIKILATTALKSETSGNDILRGFQFREFTTAEIATEPSTTSFYTENTEKPQSLYLDLDFEFASREEYWSANQYECINRTYVPSKYMRRKHSLCTRIHDFAGTSECTTFCQLAATFLLSEDLAPNISLYTRFFQIVLPQNISNMAVALVRGCFEKYGNNASYFKDCQRPQRFFKCLDDIESHLSC